MKKIGKKELVLLVLAIIVFISALGYFCYKEIPELIKPKVYYRTYTKEKGWSRWSKNGEISGNKYSIRAIQIKNSRNLDIKYSLRFKNNKWSEKTIKNKEVIGDKQDNITAIGLSLPKLEKKYKIIYRISSSNQKWYDYIENGMISYNNKDEIKYIQIKIVER